MQEAGSVSPLEVKQVAEKAFQLQTHLLRRAWGALYAVWSVSMFLTVYELPLAAGLGFSVEFTDPYRLVLNMFVSGFAIIVSMRAFKRVRETAEIRAIVSRGGWAGVLRFRVFVPLWAAIYAVAILSLPILGSREVLVLLAIYAVLWAFLFHALRLSFPGGLPPESTAVMLLFGIATVVSLAALLLGAGSGLSVILWTATIVTMVVSAAYARTRRTPTTWGEDLR